jgi:hypothetical protein
VSYCLLAVTVLCASGSVASAEEGLVLHYTFDERTGEVAKDTSGNGLDGKVNGATYVVSPRGQALHFDGVDDSVTCPASDLLNLDGDLTIEVWLRAERIDERNRMIFGDAAGYTINRNYNLRLDRSNLRFEYADNDSYGVILHDASLLDDHNWHHLALICEYPRYYLYYDGERVETGGLSQPIRKTKGAQRMIGGWFAGHFQGDIDDVRLYDRALPQRLIVAHAKGNETNVPSTLDLQAHLQYSHKRVRASVILDGPADPSTTMDFALTRRGATRPGKTVRVAPQLTRPGSERWLADADLPIDALESGEYAVTAVARAGGTEVAGAETSVEVPERPLWFNSKAGITNEVLSPFTPVRVVRDEGRTTLGVWGREYALGEGLLPAQIVSQGAELLAGPIAITARRGGEPIRWQAASPEASRASPAHASTQRRFADADTELTVRTDMEYDGLLTVRWELRARRTTTLDGLALEIPLKREYAKYLYTWPKVRSGEFREAYSSGFQPIIWLGDEQRGLQWTCESDQDWQPADPEKAIEVAPEADRVVLRLHLVDQPVELTPSHGLTYTFGLHATPVKPIEKTAWDYRIFRNPWYGYSLDVPDKEVEGKPALRYFAEKGGRAMLVLRWWDAFAYTSPQSHAEALRRLVRACHAEGIKVVPYIGGFLLAENTPEGRCFMEEMEKVPVAPYPIDRLPGLESQMTRIVCQRGPWQDFLVDGIARLIDESDVDGVYLDSTSRPCACSNELHGCGYRDAKGAPRPTYPVFATRELLKRIYTVVKQRKPNGIVDLHVFDCMHAGALAFSTTYWNGEQLGRGPKVKVEGLPLDRFRTEFMGYNWGTPADLLYYVLGNYRACSAIALLHDVPVRVENLKDLDVESALWRVREEFGVDGAEFLPYWRNAEYVAATPEGCYVSLHRHPEGRVLAVVSNLKLEAAQAELVLNREALGLKGAIAARDALGDTPVQVEGEHVKLTLPGQDFRVLWIDTKAG